MENLFVIMLCIFVVAAIVYAVARTLRGQNHRVMRVSAHASMPGDFPYKMKLSLLTSTEHNFYSFLAQAVTGEMHIFSKVRLADLIEPREDIVGKRGHFNRISQKHVDFVLCAPDLLRPMLVIELDDSSHDSPEAQIRDNVKDAALKAAGLPILRIPAQQTYQVGALAEAIRVQLRVNATGLLSEFQVTTRPAVGNGFLAVLRRMSAPDKKPKKIALCGEVVFGRKWEFPWWSSL